MTTEFDPIAFNTPAPAWTKRPGVNLDRLADYILTRTPPHSYGHANEVFVQVVRRNQKALRYWTGGYLGLTERVVKRLISRDGPF